MAVINVPGAAKYGRQAGGADIARDEWWGQQATNDGRQAANNSAFQWAQGQAAGGTGNQAQENAQLAGNEASGAGGHQANAQGLARAMAYGMSPSEGAYQLQAGLDSASRMQSAIGRSARGGAALATAGANQQANTANLQQNSYTQGGLLRAQEMAQGRQMYGQQLGQQREQDQARMGMANEMSQFNAQQGDKYRLGMGQAAIGLGQAGLGGQEVDFNYYQQGMNPVNAQTQAQQQYQQWLDSARRQAVSGNQENP